MESTAQNSQFTARSQAHVWSALFSQIFDRKDGSHQVFGVIPLTKCIYSFTGKLALLVVVWCGFLLFLVNSKWLILRSSVFCFFFIFVGAVLRKGILGCLNCRDKVVPFTASEPIRIDWVSWRVHLGLRYLIIIPFIHLWSVLPRCLSLYTWCEELLTHEIYLPWCVISWNCFWISSLRLIFIYINDFEIWLILWMRAIYPSILCFRT